MINHYFKKYFRGIYAAFSFFCSKIEKNRSFTSLVVLFLLLLFGPQITLGQISEYEIKTIFIERFNEFIDFPENSEWVDNDDFYRISVIGNNPFGNDLETYFSDKKINGKNVVVSYITRPEQIKVCNLLFIPYSERNRIDRILSVTHNKPIITIGDTEGYGSKGVLINFYMDNNRIRFEINFDAVQKTGLYMNYRLLKLAKVINSSEAGK